MTMRLKSKLPDVGLTIFSVMTQISNQNNAINLSQGFPDFDVPAELIDLVEKHMRSGCNQYAPMQGVAALRERIAGKVREIYGAAYDPLTEITVTSGATEALYAAITATIRAGDEVIVFEPAYDSYVPAIRLNGGIPIYIRLRYPDYQINWDEVKDSITPKTRAMIFNSPHNPTGSVLSGKDMAALTEIVRKGEIVIISDEVYEHIVFDGLYHESMCRYPELYKRSFVISSFGKTYHATGWKVAYCLAPEPLSREIQKIHQFLTFATNTPIQYALADYLEKREAYRNLGAFYQEKRDRFLGCIRNSAFKAIPSRGTYFQMLDYSDISREPDIEFAKRLTIEYGVASIPPSVFYHNKEDNRVLRFCFAKKDETLEKAGEKLCRISR
ncbi:MAG: methionine aminotransferase [Deltaproteobacteria bacterium RBG_13_49_15]|nr:MAG: methionine aminotransferase [Deltaproteobacteria bacterium RBG_13_49_15]